MTDASCLPERLSLEEGDRLMPPESRSLFSDGDVTCWLSRDDVDVIESLFLLAQMTIAVVEDDPDWLDPRFKTGTSIDNKRQWVELALRYLGKPRLFGWHRHEVIERRTLPAPPWDRLHAEHRITDVTRKAQIHGYTVLASPCIGEREGAALQHLVMIGVAALRQTVSDDATFALKEPCERYPARLTPTEQRQLSHRRHRLASTESVTIARVSERTVVLFAA